MPVTRARQRSALRPSRSPPRSVSNSGGVADVPADVAALAAALDRARVRQELRCCRRDPRRVAGGRLDCRDDQGRHHRSSLTGRLGDTTTALPVADVRAAAGPMMSPIVPSRVVGSNRMPNVGLPSPQPAMGYQPGLDGLRAISVIAVILYHAGFGWMHGGFLGVEVFFVVSGLPHHVVVDRGTGIVGWRVAAAVLVASERDVCFRLCSRCCWSYPPGRRCSARPNRPRSCGAICRGRSSTSPTGARSSATFRTSSPATRRCCATSGAWPSRSSGTSCGR